MSIHTHYANSQGLTKRELQKLKMQNKQSWEFISNQMFFNLTIYQLRLGPNVQGTFVCTSCPFPSIHSKTSLLVEFLDHHFTP